jgi:hypothetical protein
MKNFFFLSCLFLLGIKAFAGTIILEGKYQNKNLYVQNTFGSEGVGFCTYEITVNGKTSIDEVNTSTFEIDFEPFGFKIGTPVTVQIKHKDGCAPKILNPEVLRPRATFETTSINVDKNGLLTWSAANETGSLPFIIEQYRWNKWIKVGEITGKGTSGNNSYSFQTALHSGENKFRVKQQGFIGQAKFSPQVNFVSTLPELTFTVSENGTEILLSGESLYEVFDGFGTVVKKGYGKSISTSNLKAGIYYFCFDNTTAEYSKK